MLDRDLLRLMLEGTAYDGNCSSEILDALMKQAQDVISLTAPPTSLRTFVLECRTC
jgi:hypothetical protein